MKMHIVHFLPFAALATLGHGLAAQDPALGEAPVLADDKLVSWEEGILIPAPLALVWGELERAPLEELLPGAKGIPRVIGTEPLSEKAFPIPGARRRVLLADNSSAVEQVLENDPERYFSYVVWGYTSKVARPIEYATGEFWYSAEGPQQTRILWRYSFKLKSNKFPGYLGPLGRWLFGKTFLSREYASFMRVSLEQMREYVMAKR